MSVILDALKKADHDRNLMTVPNLASVHLETEETKRPILPWVFAVALVASGAAASWAWPDWFARIGRLLPDSERRVGSVITSNDQPASHASRSPEAADAPVSTPTAQGNTGALEPPETLKKVPPREAPSGVRPAQRPERAVPLAPQETSLVLPSIGQTDSDVISSTELSGAAPVTPSRIESPTAAEAGTRQPTATHPARTEVSAVPPAQTTPSRLHQAVARMSLNGVVYSEQRGERKVYIDGRAYIEGDLVDGVFRVDEIRPEGATLSDQGEQALLRLADKRH